MTISLYICISCKIFFSIKNQFKSKKLFLSTILNVLINDPCLRKLTKSPEKSSLIRSYCTKENVLLEIEFIKTQRNFSFKVSSLGHVTTEWLMSVPCAFVTQESNKEESNHQYMLHA